MTGGVFMSRKDIVKVSFNEDLQEESYYFMKRLVEKVLMVHRSLVWVKSVNNDTTNKTNKAVV